MPEQIVRANFTKGIDQRIHPERGREDRLHRLQNARLQERGETLQVSRIQGYQYIANSPTTFDLVYDSLFYQDELVVYWYDTSAGDAHITFIDINGGGETDLSFAATQAPYGELTLLEDNIYLTPYNKQLNMDAGTWRLNDFISTTPFFTIQSNSGGRLDARTFYWYKARFVYSDGHKTKTNYPEFIYTSSNNKTAVLNFNNIPDDLDGTVVDVEVFRKEGN
ncbi:MAG TPA: hypothetical protein VLA13_06460, partial [Massilibacterium sp.]|nr:hypothetical protein [Massilibacterium sp.]